MNVPNFLESGNGLFTTGRRPRGGLKSVSPTATDTALLSATGFFKSYGHVEALRGASLEVRPGEVVGLVGDNGAGKSTMLKAIAGAVVPDRGELEMDGRRVRTGSTEAARAAGIETLYQDLALAPDLDVVANLYLGRELLQPGLRGLLGELDKRAMWEEGPRLLAEMGVNLPSLKVPVATLSGGQRQIIAVARALAWGRQLVLMDEPTAALGVVQTEKVAELIVDARARGTAVVIVSHNLPELRGIVDRFEVMRLGQIVASIPVAEATTTTLVSAMTGLDDEESERNV
jgi:simple sugar transport system ATP-binding protein